MGNYRGQTGPKRTQRQREADLVTTSALYLTGHTYRSIAAELGVSHVQVTHDIRALLKRWQATQLLNIGDVKARELERIDRVEEELWKAWDRSKKRAARSVTRRLVGEDTSGQVRIDEDSGDPRYLDSILRCIEKRCAIFGLDAPVKTELSAALLLGPPPNLDVHFSRSNGEGQPVNGEGETPSDGVELKPHKSSEEPPCKQRNAEVQSMTSGSCTSPEASGG